MGNSDMKIGGAGVGITLLSAVVLFAALAIGSAPPAAAEPGDLPDDLSIGAPSQNKSDGTVADARMALDTGDFARAAKILRPLADEGDIAAQTNLAVLYLQGKGVTQSDQQAAQWFEKAARQGSAPAALDLGILYRNGQGVAKDLVQADRWIEISLPDLNGQDRVDATKFRDALNKEMTDSQKQDARDLIDNCMQVGVKYCD